VERFCVIGDKCDSSNLKYKRTWLDDEDCAIQHAGELLRKKGPVGDFVKCRLFVVKVVTVVELEPKPVYSRAPEACDFPKP
jgi:hypothetical protein